jgi:hypothetical protein
MQVTTQVATALMPLAQTLSCFHAFLKGVRKFRSALFLLRVHALAKNVHVSHDVECPK